MGKTSRAAGAAPMFGDKPEPDDELELHATEGQLAEGEGEAPPAEITSDEPPLTSPAERPPGTAKLDVQQREAELVRPELEAHEPAPGGPVREHRIVHVVQTERRGSARWSTRTVGVGVEPVQILGANVRRRRAVIQIAASTDDGYFVAFGPWDRITSGVKTDFSGGAVGALPIQLGGVFLMPLMVPGADPSRFPPDDFTIEHVREVWAVFIPDSSLEAAGAHAFVSVSEEQGDAGLEQEEDVPPGTAADR